MFLDTQENKNIREWCSKNDIIIDDKDFCLFKKILIEQNLLCTFNDVLEENIKYFEIKCPKEYLNEEVIVANDSDYVEVGDNLYLNINQLYNNIDDIFKSINKHNLNKSIAWIDVTYENNDMYLSFYNDDGDSLHEEIIINNVTEEEARKTQERIRKGMPSSDFYGY